MTARHIETVVDTAASACLGGATAYAAFTVMAPWLGQPLAIAGSAAVATLAYWCGQSFLARIGCVPGQSVPAEEYEELLLVDPVSEPRPSAQVVRLFDPTSPNPAWAGQAEALPSAALPDATEALHDALNRLRRSLR